MLVKEASEVVRGWVLLGCRTSIAVEVARHHRAGGLKNVAKASLDREHPESLRDWE